MTKRILATWLLLSIICSLASAGLANNRIALLRSEYTFDLYERNGWGSYDSLHVLPANLLLSELPYQYDVVSDYFIEQDSLRMMGYTLLIVPDATVMSIIECYAIEDFVRDGGTAFITGTSGIHDGSNWLNVFWLSPAMGVQWPGFQRDIAEGSFWNMNKMLSGDPIYDAVLKGVFEKNRGSEEDSTENDIAIKNGWDDGTGVPIFPTTGKLLGFWTDYNLDSLQSDPRGHDDKAWAIACNKFGNGYVVYFNGKLFSGYRYCREIPTWAHRDSDPCQNAEKIVFNVIRNFADVPISNMDLAAWWIQRQHHENSKLVDSYEDGDRQFGHDAAFLYDQALAVMVYCALAKHDPVNADTYRKKSFDILDTHLRRIRNTDGSFYFTWEHKEGLDPINEARFSGANAWLLMAINRYVEQFGDASIFQFMASSLAEWLYNQIDASAGALGAVRGGINAAGQQLSFKSVEHNLDAYAAFAYHGYLTGDVKFTAAAQCIRRWLENVTWDDATGHFLRGENDPVATMDVNPWGILALGTTGWNGRDFTRGLDWAIENCRNTHAWEGAWDPYPHLIGTIDGFDFDNDKDVVWVEGTESMALALRLAGRDSLADYFHTEMAKLIPAANNGGLPYATNEGTIAADDDSRSTTYPSVAGTAWYIFKELNYNPFEIPPEAHPDPDSIYDIVCDVSSAVDQSGSPITEFRLFPNYPNPFNPETVIRFQVPIPSDVELTIYNLLGQVVRQLARGKYASGSHDLVWDGTDESGARVASGLYLYRISAAEYTAQRKLVMIK